MSQVRVVAFDAYGTLLDVQSILDVARETLDDRAVNVVDLWRAKQLEYSWLRTLMGTYADFDQVSRDALSYALAYFRAEISDVERQRLLDSWFRPNPFPDVPDALAALTETGMPLVILSNGSPEMLKLALEHSGLEQFFEHVLSVDAVKRFKPDPAVYRLVEERIGVLPKETLFVSSNGFDVAGAKAFGFHVCWINRAGRPLDVLGQTPDRVIASMSELPGVVRG
ncbi:MAG: haloacid dehalogenase type II [Nitrolancea sp.]